MTEYATFTRRTNDPKLRWLEGQLEDRGIKCRRKGRTFHAPVLEVEAAKIDAAWAVLEPVDDISDDDPQFSLPVAPKPCRHCQGTKVRRPGKYLYECRYCRGTGGEG